MNPRGVSMSIVVHRRAAFGVLPSTRALKARARGRLACSA
jgi:hypothetical protein